MTAQIHHLCGVCCGFGIANPFAHSRSIFSLNTGGGLPPCGTVAGGRFPTQCCVHTVVSTVLSPLHPIAYIVGALPHTTCNTTRIWIRTSHEKSICNADSALHTRHEH